LRELSLHVLDLIENALTAGATVIEVSVEQDSGRDRLEIGVEDNGPGLRVPGEQAANPFFTTKPGKKTGLGLSLLRFRCEQAGGGMEIGRSALGGVAVRARMGLRHVDRSPLGDLAATMSTVVSTSEGLDLRLALRADGRAWRMELGEVARELPEERRKPIALSRLVHEKVREGMSTLQLID